MEKLGTDFPKARIVFENSPVDPGASRGRDRGKVLRCSSGEASPAAAQLSSITTAVFDGQDGLGDAAVARR